MGGLPEPDGEEEQERVELRKLEKMSVSIIGRGTFKRVQETLQMFFSFPQTASVDLELEAA